MDYIDEQLGIVAPVPEMMSHPETPSEASPANGAALAAGTTQTELSVKVHGKQTYDVAFYWADGEFIGEDKLLREGDKAARCREGACGRKDLSVVRRRSRSACWSTTAMSRTP